MPTVKFLIQSKKSSAPIYLRLSLNRTSSYKRKTGFHINPNDWNQKKGFPKNKISLIGSLKYDSILKKYT